MIKSIKKSLYSTLTMSLGLLFVSFSFAPQASADGHKVDICHYEAESDSFKRISVSENAEQKHFANHGDGNPGGEFPSMDGYVFDEECVPVGCPCGPLANGATCLAG